MDLDLDLDHPHLSEILVSDAGGPPQPLAQFVHRFIKRDEIWGTRDRSADGTITEWVGADDEDRALRVESWGPEKRAQSMLTTRESFQPDFSRLVTHLG